MNEYMLIYKCGDPNACSKPITEMSELMEQWMAWFAMLEQNGQLANGGSPLLFAGKRITRDKIITDISAAELKELVSGYTIIKANSLEEAVAISQGCPIFEAPIDYVEVREVMQMG